MNTPTPEPKKRKLSALNEDSASFPDYDQTKITTLKLKNGLANSEDTAAMYGQATTDPNPKLSEFINQPPPPVQAPVRQEPARAFEIGELAKVVLVTGSKSSNVIVKIINHALPQANGAWQYCLNADSIMPAGTGVIWVDENNLQKVNYLDVKKGTTVDFIRNQIVMQGVVQEAKMAGRPRDLAFEVEYKCSITVGMKDIMKVMLNEDAK